jgi:hypothetical protein
MVPLEALRSAPFHLDLRPVQALKAGAGRRHSSKGIESHTTPGTCELEELDD